MLTVNASNAGGGLGTIQNRSYSCAIPGPTLCVNPGDQIKIAFTNELPPNTDECELNKPTCLNTSNIHFHGLHVSPSSTPKGVASDNVLIDVDPDGGKQEYCVWLPDFHAPGTHWYHTHRHGSTGIQVEDGMLGAIIVKEPYANKIVPEDRDKIWVIQEIINGDVYTKGSGKVPGVFLVNGLYQPKIQIQPKQWQRWRFINGTATPRGLMNLQLVKCSDSQCTTPTPASMYLIAVDGISFYGNKPQEKTGWDMSPGNRADFLIWVEEPGTYQILKETYSGGGNAASQNSTQVLATVTVTGVDGTDPNPPTNLTIPGTFPDYLKPIRQAEVLNNGSVRTKNLDFSVAAKGNYQINEMQYDPQSCDESPPSANCQQVEINTAELWTLQNVQGNIRKKGSAHPFHIHVNPFQVVGDKIDPKGADDSSNWIWWDTIAIDPEKCVPIIHRFTDYNGVFVLHCHILIHEDQGMMMNVKVNDPNGKGTGACKQLSTSNFQPGDTDIVSCDYIKLQLTDATCTNALTCEDSSS
ncbi:MAG: multicopper oxidase family protein [Xenococcus sp. MO_188.B8]|nr:multicopper oxidase family protein [Xenococcus sp. MO_188.B8]